MSVLASIDLQTLGDAFGLGAIYALMAVGIGLVFGVLRLVNFAYGQLIMAGAYTLAYTSGWPVAASIVSCFAVVVALSLAMDRVVFRPLRSSSPAVMLVTTFAIAFLLQAVALIIDLRDGQLGEVASSIAPLNQAVSVGGVDVRKVTFVAVGVAVGALIALALVLTRTTIGLHTRAAASDFRTARLLGVRANRVIAFSVVLSGLIAAAVAVMLTVQFPLVQPDFAGQFRQHADVADVLAPHEERLQDPVVVVVALAVFPGILVALERQVRMRLRRHGGQLDRHAHLPGDGIDRVLPRPLEVVAFGPQRLIRIWPKLERPPLDLDIFALGGFS